MLGSFINSFNNYIKFYSRIMGQKAHLQDLVGLGYSKTPMANTQVYSP